MRLRTRMIVTALAAAALTVSTGGVAHAGNGASQTSGGYAAQVEVHLSGDVSQGAVASVPGPPPMCWWEDLSTTMLDDEKVDTSDPAAVQKYYEEEVRPWLTGHAGVAQLSMPGPEYFKDIIKKVKAGQDMTFYALQTAESAIEGNYEDPGYDAQVRAVGQACGAPVVDGPYGAMTVGWQAFPTGQQPPPAVSPEDLAAYAYEVMDLKRPGLEWNPHLASADDATLVNLPTWLWTRDPAAVEERQVTAEAAGVSVTVTAQPNGMTVTSPVGGTECSAKQAQDGVRPGCRRGLCVRVHVPARLGSVRRWVPRAVDDRLAGDVDEQHRPGRRPGAEDDVGGDQHPGDRGPVARERTSTERTVPDEPVRTSHLHAGPTGNLVGCAHLPHSPGPG